MSAMASQITGLMIVCSSVYSGKKHQSCVTGLCAKNSPVTGESQRASSAENVSIGWRHDDNEDYYLVISQWKSHKMIQSIWLDIDAWFLCGKINRQIAWGFSKAPYPLVGAPTSSHPCWRYDMKTFSTLPTHSVGIQWSLVDSPYKSPEIPNFHVLMLVT